MQDKVLNSISEEVLLLNFNYNDKDMVFKDYLVNEVLPYMDLSKDTVMLKTGIEVSLREFIEQAVLFNCQNRYHGDFISFANDNVVGFNIKERKEQCDYTFTINRDDKTYVFYEEISGPKYIVVIRNDNVILVCRDDKHDIVMEDVRDKKDFLTRIKKLDLDLFVEVYNRYDEFQNYIRSFNQDKMFYNSLMVGVLNKTSFDDEFDKNLLEIDNLIDESNLEQIIEKNILHYRLYIIKGDLDEAECILLKTFNIAKSNSLDKKAAEISILIGRYYIGEKREAEAARYLAEGVGIFRSLGILNN